jgi:hypothetical protein
MSGRLDSGTWVRHGVDDTGKMESIGVTTDGWLAGKLLVQVQVKRPGVKRLLFTDRVDIPPSMVALQAGEIRAEANSDV